MGGGWWVVGGGWWVVGGGWWVLLLLLCIKFIILQNVLDKAENNNEMIDAGLVRMLAILSNKKWGDDDIVDDLKTISEALAKNMVVLRYCLSLSLSILSFSIPLSLQ